MGEDMADEETSKKQDDMSDERFRYIGFEVFPSKAKDLYKSEDEHKSLVERVRQKLSRSEGEVRDRCTLLEDRVSHGEKIFLTVVSALLIVSFFIPWFSGYFEIVHTEYVATTEELPAGAAADTTKAAETAPVDTSQAGRDTALAGRDTAQAMASAMDTVESMLAAADTSDTLGALSGMTDKGQDTAGMMAVTKIEHDQRAITGIGALLAIGSYGGKIFSSGFVLKITGFLLLVFMLSCFVLAGVNLYALYGIKISEPDAYALELKKWLRFNWIPVFIWLAIFILSFFGANYGFNPENMVKQVGNSYNMVTLIGLSSFGMYLALSAFLIAALKGKEI
jgi:hypothetical protein